eukprot:TRINITY_DN9375_c0_g1_i8.p1 TRINITY_DN9375_c0_g1~~TRINITY_DN9375_c0_g1_i8.p1  ORF type:complete len:1171 (-),score=273.51 TRINITY_DN9375_c0_g1_i8:27-3338(-)
MTGVGKRIFGRGQFDSIIHDQENHYRGLYATRPQSAELRDPTSLLSNVFQNRDMYNYLPDEAHDMSQPILLTADREAHVGPSIVTRSTFEDNWNTFTKNVLRGMDWTGCVVAGGAVLACLLPDAIDTIALRHNEVSNKHGFGGSDIDMFICGLTEEQADRKIKEIYDSISANLDTNCNVMRTRHAITIVTSFPYRHVQIILRLYQNMQEVIMGFDIDCCAVCYDGKDVYALPRARRAINKQYNVFDASRRSLTYEQRLFKYSQRGFAVQVPALDSKAVNANALAHPGFQDENIYFSFGKRNACVRTRRMEKGSYLWQSRYKEITSLGSILGLQRLLHHDVCYSNPRRFEPRKKIGESFVHRREVDDISGKENPSDYSPVGIPWGPKWRADAVARSVLFKDHNQFFAYYTNNHSIRHRHVVMTGIEDVITGTATWCTQCKGGEDADSGDDDSDNDNTVTTSTAGKAKGAKVAAKGAKAAKKGDEDGTSSLAVSGPIKWESIDPGRQLLTGSFHPVDDDQWFATAYHDAAQQGTHKLCVDAFNNCVIGNDITMATQVNGHDEYLGRTPLHWAALMGAVDSIRALITLGAEPDAKDYIQEATALHFAVFGNSAPAVRALLEGGASVKSVNVMQMTPLHYAAMWGDAECVRLLLDKGANVNQKDQEERTPLVCAIFSERIDIVQMLLDHGAIQLPYNHNSLCTPQLLAQALGCADIDQLLKTAAAAEKKGAKHKHNSSDDSDGDDDGKGQQIDDRPHCQYGMKCYRKNPVHFKEMQHPPGHPMGVAKPGTTTTTSTSTAKKPKAASAAFSTTTAATTAPAVPLTFAAAAMTTAAMPVPKFAMTTAPLWNQVPGLSLFGYGGYQQQKPVQQPPQPLGNVFNSWGGQQDLSSIKSSTADRCALSQDSWLQRSVQNPWLPFSPPGTGAAVGYRTDNLLQPASSIPVLERVFLSDEPESAKRLIKMLDDGLWTVNEADDAGVTALHVAASYNRVDLAKQLLTRHADSKARDLHGQTPLHYAVHANHLAMIHVLLQHGDSTAATLVNCLGESPLYVAMLRWLCSTRGDFTHQQLCKQKREEVLQCRAMVAALREVTTGDVCLFDNMIWYDMI